MDFARNLNVTSQQLLEHAHDYIENDNYWSEGGRFEGVGLPKGFWEWYQQATGEELPKEKLKWGGSFFSCSCYRK